MHCDLRTHRDHREQWIACWPIMGAENGAWEHEHRVECMDCTSKPLLAQGNVVQGQASTKRGPKSIHDIAHGFVATSGVGGMTVMRVLQRTLYDMHCGDSRGLSSIALNLHEAHRNPKSATRLPTQHHSCVSVHSSTVHTVAVRAIRGTRHTSQERGLDSGTERHCGQGASLCASRL
jgi:hypothetical protein